MERYELELFKKGELAIEDSEEEKEDPKVSSEALPLDQMLSGLSRL